MANTPDFDALRARVSSYGQLHVLDFWNEIGDAGRIQLAGQLDAIDLGAVADLYRGKVGQPDWADLARRAVPPRAYRVDDREIGRAAVWGGDGAVARQRGIDALQAGEIGVLLVAGGQGSRLGFDHPKGMFPIGPLSGATLLQIHFEKVRAAAHRYRRRIKLYVMTSPVTHEETIEFIDRQNRFGLDDEDLVVFCQGVMPAVDAATGQLLLEAKDSLFLSPDGHGGTLGALACSGAIDHMKHCGVKHLFYLQVDNPLAPICDPELLGHHLLAQSELTSLAIAKQDPHDKLGNFVVIDDKLHVIEYSDFPPEAAARTNDDQSLKFWAGSVAIHVFDCQFLERALAMRDALPFHVALKKAPFVDRDGTVVCPTEPNALKFERFIFDLLPHARRPIVVEYRERDAFAPLKNGPGANKDTPAYVQRFLIDQGRRWLQEAGAVVAPNVQVEISPLFALDAEATAERVAPGSRFDHDTYLRPPLSLS